jgi:hypothetical protein
MKQLIIKDMMKQLIIKDKKKQLITIDMKKPSQLKNIRLIIMLFLKIMR